MNKYLNEYKFDKHDKRKYLDYVIEVVFRKIIWSAHWSLLPRGSRFPFKYTIDAREAHKDHTTFIMFATIFLDNNTSHDGRVQSADDTEVL